MTGIELGAVRSDTPGCVDQVFLDSAGSSLPPAPVLDEVIGHLRREAEIGGYRASEERADDLAAGYRAVAELLDCEPDEVAFTDSATRSWLAAFDAVPLGPGDRVLITEAEYASNAIALLRRAEEVGARVEPVPSDPSGQVDVAALGELLDERVRLVSLVHAPTNGGLVNPVREVVRAAHDVGAPVLLDACQSVGQLPVRVRETGVDMVSATGRKWLRGPRGTGILAIRRDVADRLRPRHVDLIGGTWEDVDRVRLREDARVHELFEYSIAGRLGLIAAARYALALGMPAIHQAVTERAERLRAGLAELPGVQVRDIGRERSGIVTFTVDGVPAQRVRDELRAAGVTVTVSRAPSTLLDMRRRGLTELVRASPHYFVSPEQLDTCVAAVAALRG